MCSADVYLHGLSNWKIGMCTMYVCTPKSIIIAIHVLNGLCSFSVSKYDTCYRVYCIAGQVGVELKLVV